MAKILIVEDDQQLADSVRTALLFDHHLVEIAADGDAATHLLRMSAYDLLILDWNLPGSLSGVDICRNYRATGGQSPIIMLTGKSEVADKATGLDSGADDYISKPFHLKEVTARVRAQLRRPGAYLPTVLQVGNLSLDPKKHRVEKDGQLVSLLPKEFALLEFMMRNPNQVFTPESLLAHVWPANTEVSIAAVRTTMKRLRDRIDPDGSVIRTEHSVGYVLANS